MEAQLTCWNFQTVFPRGEERGLGCISPRRWCTWEGVSVGADSGVGRTPLPTKTVRNKWPRLEVKKKDVYLEENPWAEKVDSRRRGITKCKGVWTFSIVPYLEWHLLHHVFPIMSPFNSPVWPLQKPEGSWKIIVDYCKPNQDAA